MSEQTASYPVNNAQFDYLAEAIAKLDLVKLATESLVKSGADKHPDALTALDDLVGESLSLVKQAIR